MASMVFVAIPEDKASILAKKLLEQKFCACVNIIKGVESMYWWQGKIDTSREALMIIKTKDSLVPRLQVAIKEGHPYQVPEMLAVRIDSINKEYLVWLNKEVDAYGFTPET